MRRAWGPSLPHFLNTSSFKILNLLLCKSFQWPKAGKIIFIWRVLSGSVFTDFTKKRSLSWAVLWLVGAVRGLVGAVAGHMVGISPAMTACMIACMRYCRQYEMQRKNDASC